MHIFSLSNIIAQWPNVAYEFQIPNFIVIYHESLNHLPQAAVALGALTALISIWQWLLATCNVQRATCNITRATLENATMSGSVKYATQALQVTCGWTSVHNNLLRPQICQEWGWKVPKCSIWYWAPIQWFLAIAFKHATLNLLSNLYLYTCGAPHSLRVARQRALFSLIHLLALELPKFEAFNLSWSPLLGCLAIEAGG